MLDLMQELADLRSEAQEKYYDAYDKAWTSGLRADAKFDPDVRVAKATLNAYEKAFSIASKQMNELHNLIVDMSNYHCKD